MLATSANLRPITVEELEKRRCCNNTVICARTPPVFYGSVAVSIFVIIILIALSIEDLVTKMKSEMQQRPSSSS